MRVRRLLAAVITTALVAPVATVVASTSPASAATATRIVSAYTDRDFVYTSSKPASFGDNVYSGAVVVDANGSRVYEGTLSLQRQLAGQSTWTTVATGSSSLYSTTKAAGNAAYRVVYTGTGTYASSVSSAVGIKVQRKLDIDTISGRKAGFKGKLSPKGKVKIAVQKKVGKKFTKFRTLRSDKKGRFTIVLPAPRRGKFFWKITFKGSRQFTSSIIKGSTYSY